MSASSMELVSVLISLAAFAFAAWLFSWVKKQPLDNERIIQVGGLIQQGARTFLKREFMVLARFCVCAALLIFLFLPSPIWTGSFVPNLMMVMHLLFIITRQLRCLPDGSAYPYLVERHTW